MLSVQMYPAYENVSFDDDEVTFGYTLFTLRGFEFCNLPQHSDVAWGNTINWLFMVRPCFVC